MLKFLSATVSAAVILTGAAAANAQSNGQPSPTEYLTRAAQNDQFEIKEGELAQQKGSGEIKRFGAKMVADHTKSSEDLMAAATTSGLHPMSAPSLRPDQDQMIAKLQGLKGSDFDSNYIRQQVGAHNDALALHEQYSENGSDPNLRRVAGRIVPVVQMHLSDLHAMDQ